MSTATRIPNLPREAWTAGVEALFPIMLPPGSRAKGSDFNSILVLAQHAELAEPWLRFNAAASRGFDLPASLKEIAILRTAWRRGSQYEWGHHMLSGLSNGLTTEHFSGLQMTVPGREFTTAETAVILATDDICVQGGITDATWPAISRELDTRQIMELLFVVGGYIALAAILKTAGAPLEPQIAAQIEALELPALSPNHCLPRENANDR